MKEEYYIFNSKVCRYQEIDGGDYVFEVFDYIEGWKEDNTNMSLSLQDALHDYGNYSASEVSKISKEHAMKIAKLQAEQKSYHVPELIQGLGLREYLE